MYINITNWEMYILYRCSVYVKLKCIEECVSHVTIGLSCTGSFFCLFMCRWIPGIQVWESPPLKTVF